MIDLSTTLGDLVTADPRRAAVLEAAGLDYCCHGQRTLAQAAAEANLDAEAVAASLDLPDPEPTPAWQEMSIGELAIHVEGQHHHYIWNNEPRLRALADKVAGVHGERHPELAQVRADVHALLDDLAQHLTKEERILFPAIRALSETGQSGFGDLRGPISVMLAEHDVAGEIAERLRSTTHGYTTPDDGCASYEALMRGLEEFEADLHEHIHKENNVLFPRTMTEQEAALNR